MIVPLARWTHQSSYSSPPLMAVDVKRLPITLEERLLTYLQLLRINPLSYPYQTSK